MGRTAIYVYASGEVLNLRGQGIFDACLDSGSYDSLSTYTFKISCLFFYRRLFSPSRKITIFVDGGVIAIPCGYTAPFSFATLFECIPVSKNWNRYEPGHCTRPKVLPYPSGAINIVSDLYVLILPIPCKWRLNMKLSRKLRILAIFGLGIL